MSAKSLSVETMREVISIYRGAGNSVQSVAAAMNIPYSTAKSRVYSSLAAEARGDLKAKSGGFEAIKLPDSEVSTEELISYRKKVFGIKSESELARKLIRVKVKIGGPIGIVHFGDPHVDDDGCDIAQLEKDLKITRTTEGLFGANLGDMQNNWIGRLSRLWAEQSTSANQAWKLVEWLVTSVDWMYIVGGNHDTWSGAGDPVKWMMKSQSGVYEAHGCRVGLEFPNGKQVRINARHDFRGHSMWNPAHGPMKAIQGGWRDHILTCGHKHVSFIGGPMKDPSSGLLSWAIRCAGYKVHDRYAAQEGLPDQNAFPACVTIIDPQYQDDDPRLVTVVPSVAEGADYLKFKRKRWKG